MRASSPSTWLALAGLALLLSIPAAQAAGDGTDAGVIGVPDASVGQGGSDQSQQEGDDNTGQVVTACHESRDCNKGFACNNTRCVYIGFREASGGCLLGVDAGAGAVLGVLLVGARRFVRRARR